MATLIDEADRAKDAAEAEDESQGEMAKVA